MIFPFPSVDLGITVVSVLQNTRSSTLDGEGEGHIWVPVPTTPKCDKEPIWYVTFHLRDRHGEGTAQLRSATESRRNHRSCEWTSTLSDMVIVPAQKLSGRVSERSLRDLRVNELHLATPTTKCNNYPVSSGKWLKIKAIKQTKKTKTQDISILL